MKKAGITLGAVAGIILILTSFGIIGTSLFAAEVKISDKIPGQLCHGSNAARAATSIDSGVMNVDVVPRFCKTDHKVIPTKKKQQTTEGVLKEIRDISTNCWWQWLEGGKEGMFGKSWPWSQNKCFVCYTFDIKKSKNIDEISIAEFSDFMRESPYIARDTSNKCSRAGGGFCNSKGCKESEGWMAVDGKDGVCKLDQSCCVALSNRDKCVNKGGVCEVGGCPSSHPIEYTDGGWTCGSGKCCIKKNNYFSAIDYIQFFKGQGRLIIEGDIEEFNPQGSKKADTYAVAFVQENDDDFWESVFLAGGGAILGTVYVVGTGGVGLIPIAIGASLGGTAGYYAKVDYEAFQDDKKDTNAQILITSYNSIRDKCLIQQV